MLFDDELKHVRALPDAVLAEFAQVLVNQQGETPDAYKITTNIVGHIEPGTWYRIDLDGLHTTLRDVSALQADPVPAPEPPQHVRVPADYRRAAMIDLDTGGVLGGSGFFLLDEDCLTVPEAPATPENLGFFGAHLLELGSPVCFETVAELPVAVLDIGDDYLDGFAAQEAHGGGYTLEASDQPRFLMPLDERCGGHLILGTKLELDYVFSAFQIPMGKAVYLPPYTTYADHHLTGRHLVLQPVNETRMVTGFASPGDRLGMVRVATRSAPGMADGASQGNHAP